MVLECYDSAYKIWTDYTLTGWGAEFAGVIGGWDFSVIDLWEEVSLGGEGGSQRLPVHASAGVFRCLVGLSGMVNRHCGFGLEIVNLRYFIQGLCRVVLDTYSTFVNENTISVGEKGALQLLFDFRFMVKIIEGGWTGEGVLGRNVLAGIKEMIDPVDLAVADMGIVGGVERAYSRGLISFGVLCALNPKPIELKRTGGMLEVHSVVGVAAQPPRFNLLPIAGSVEAGAVVIEGTRRARPAVKLNLIGGGGISTRGSPRSRMKKEQGAGDLLAGELFNAAGSLLSGIWGSGNVSGTPKTKKKASPSRRN